MESPERGALMLVRIIALALIGWAVAEIALYYAVAHHNQRSIALEVIVFKALPFLAGVVILIRAKSIAAWISDRLDL